MKHVVALVCALAVSGCCAQDLLSVPPDTIATRMNIASTHMTKAAWNRNTAAWFALFGGIFTALAADKSASGYNEQLAIGLGAVTVTGFLTLQWNGARHDQKAARALHFQ